MKKTESKYSNGELAWQLKDFPRIIDPKGELGVVEFGKEFDFDVKRAFFLRGISKGGSRGFHAHRELKQLVICLSGSFKILLDNGRETHELLMKEDGKCLFLDGRVWREMFEFSETAVMLVLCDREYRFDEVVRNYQQFKEYIKEVG